jgi:hypothetical protein
MWSSCFSVKPEEAELSHAPDKYIWIRAYQPKAFAMAAGRPQIGEGLSLRLLQWE